MLVPVPSSLATPALGLSNPVFLGDSVPLERVGKHRPTFPPQCLCKCYSIAFAFLPIPPGLFPWSFIGTPSEVAVHAQLGRRHLEFVGQSEDTASSLACLSSVMCSGLSTLPSQLRQLHRAGTLSAQFIGQMLWEVEELLASHRGPGDQTVLISGPGVSEIFLNLPCISQVPTWALPPQYANGP